MDISHKNWNKIVLMCFLLVLKKECIGHPKLLYITHLSEIYEQKNLKFFNKIGWLEVPWLVTSDKILLSKVTGGIGFNGTSSYVWEFITYCCYHRRSVPHLSDTQICLECCRISSLVTLCKRHGTRLAEQREIIPTKIRCQRRWCRSIWKTQEAWNKKFLYWVPNTFDLCFHTLGP